MFKHVVFRIFAGLVLLAAIAGIAFFAFSAGMAHGAALDIKGLATQGDGQPVPFYSYGTTHFYFPPFGFGCFGLLAPIFLFFLAFAALRHLLWGPRWWGWGWRHRMHHMHGYGPWGEKDPWGDDVPPMVAEWHRRMHENPPSEATNKNEGV